MNFAMMMVVLTALGLGFYMGRQPGLQAPVGPGLPLPPDPLPGPWPPGYWPLPIPVNGNAPVNL